MNHTWPVSHKVMHDDDDGKISMCHHVTMNEYSSERFERISSTGTVEEKEEAAFHRISPAADKHCGRWSDLLLSHNKERLSE